MDVLAHSCAVEALRQALAPAERRTAETVRRQMI